MKEEIKLTQKQEQILRRYNELLAKHDYQIVYVDEAYVDMTALNKIVGANWFDRTFEALVQKGLLVKVEQEKTAEEGYFAGKKYTDWYWELTDLGFEYLGIDNPTKPVEGDKEAKPLEKSTTVVTPEQHKEKVIDAAQPMTKDMILPYKLVCKDCNTVIESNEEYIYNSLTGCYHHKKCGGSHLILELNPINNK